MVREPLHLSWLLQGVSVAGIHVPSRQPFFLATVVVHVAAGIVAVLAGAVAMLSRKAAGRHPSYGTVYFRALALVTATMGILAIGRWPDDNHLAVLGILAFASAYAGRRARRQQWSRWPLVHIPGMGASYVFMLTAFYVDNGPQLPGWRHLPVAAFWLLPSVIGIPFILHATRKYRHADSLEDGPRVT